MCTKVNFQKKGTELQLALPLSYDIVNWAYETSQLLISIIIIVAQDNSNNNELITSEQHMSAPAS